MIIASTVIIVSTMIIANAMIFADANVFLLTQMIFTKTKVKFFLSLQARASYITF